jgi:hypothetical protein
MDDVLQTENIRRAMAPTREEIAAAPLSTSTKIVTLLLGGLPERARGSVLDVGCGNGRFTRVIAPLFREAGGIDVKAKRIHEAREAAAAAGVTIDFRVASAEEMPYPDASFDVVAFSNSLHHMPHPDTALAEAARVLKSGGFLYMMEPVPSGTYFDATKIVNDETPVRTAAFRAIAALEGKGFAAKSEVLYRGRRTFPSFDEWIAGQIEQDAERRARYEAQPDTARRLFETSAERGEGGFTFDQVSRVNLLHKTA